jgi:hypothetical protein
MRLFSRSRSKAYLVPWISQLSTSMTRRRSRQTQSTSIPSISTFVSGGGSPASSAKRRNISSRSLRRNVLPAWRFSSAALTVRLPGRFGWR